MITIDILNDNTQGQELLKKWTESGRSTEQLIEIIQPFEKFPLGIVLGFLFQLMEEGLSQLEPMSIDEIKKYMSADENSLLLFDKLEKIGYNRYFVTDYLNQLNWIKEKPSTIDYSTSIPQTLEEYWQEQRKNIIKDEPDIFGSIIQLKNENNEVRELANTISIKLKNIYSKIGNNVELQKDSHFSNEIKSMFNILSVFIKGYNLKDTENPLLLDTI